MSGRTTKHDRVLGLLQTKAGTTIAAISKATGWQLDRRTRQLVDPAGTPVALTKGEYATLVAFLEAPQRPLSREHLLQATRVHEDVFDRSIDVQILRLRRKLERDPSAPRVIQTERGVGICVRRCRRTPLTLSTIHRHGNLEQARLVFAGQRTLTV